MFAVFEAKGFQYLGSPGEKLRIPRLDTKIGEKVTFDKVLLVKNGDTRIGQPYIEGASIIAKIVEHGRYKKIVVFKFKRRNRYRRKKGHRQTYTEIEIKDIILGGKVKTKKKSEKEEGKAEKKTEKAKKATAKKKEISRTTRKAKKKPAVAKRAEKTTKKTAKAKKTTTKKKKTTAKPKQASSKAKKTKKSTSKTKKKKK